MSISKDFALWSRSKVTYLANKRLRCCKYGVSILDSAEAVAEQSDAVLLISVDGRVHLDIFRKIAHYGKPVFIDKPFTANSEHAEEIFRIAAKYGVSLMSCSSLRYAEELNKELLKADDLILGAD